MVPGFVVMLVDSCYFIVDSIENEAGTKKRLEVGGAIKWLAAAMRSSGLADILVKSLERFVKLKELER
jgi:hypothetical protein